ncbi:hypothetical protein [Piscinibacter gummiphilus]|uniref:Uncharacterized protein n=1 Tax=Piscinibacter gummiphilus TaxID=946333 RepID=A0ABZ0CPH0_9BURK|nr:hypothetical protein [Piscinibacter gummiphilus]WOB06886.1 hypothetical protein RXV79_18410 [Piscinibacter gummiphilus]
MTTPLYPTFEKRIGDAVDVLIRVQVEPWVFLNAGHPMKLSMFDGRPIHYQGIGFEGSPRHVFWGRYIEPFLEDLAIKQIASAVKEARERQVDAKLLLPEVQNLLLAACTKVYRRMAQIDQSLLGKGFPEKVRLRSTTREYEEMSSFIKKHIDAELEMWKPRPWYEGWYERNKFVVWAVGTVIAIAGLAVKFL